MLVTIVFAFIVVLFAILFGTVVFWESIPTGWWRKKPRPTDIDYIDITDKVIEVGGSPLPDGLQYRYRSRSGNSYRPGPVVYIIYDDYEYYSCVDTYANDPKSAVLSAAREAHAWFNAKYQKDSRIRSIENFVNGNHMTKIVKSEKAYED